MALRDHLSGRTDETITILASDACRTAQAAFDKAEQEGLSNKLVSAANAAARVIIRLEPQLEHGNGALALMIQPDAQGIAGDVRDVVCVRGARGWEIGISCKHNHHAVKHSRLAKKIILDLALVLDAFLVFISKSPLCAKFIETKKWQYRATNSVLPQTKAI